MKVILTDADLREIKKFIGKKEKQHEYHNSSAALSLMLREANYKLAENLADPGR